MNPTHLGDALDHWEGDLLRRLEHADALHKLGIVGMFTDAWGDEALATYARLLHRDGRDAIVLGARPFPGPDRAAYWRDVAAACPERDLFLDPDTGLALKPTARHVTPAEVAGLATGGRLVVVYQHAWRTAGTAAERLGAHAARCGKLAVCSGQAGMVFACEDENRIVRLRIVLRELYGCASGRVVNLRDRG